MRLIAELTMPNCGSWNGRWSGERDKHTVAINVAPKRAEELIGNYYYRWSDGWGANVCIRKPELREKASGNFCGYNWMIDSIKLVGKILDTEGLREVLRLKREEEEKLRKQEALNNKPKLLKRRASLLKSLAKVEKELKIAGVDLTEKKKEIGFF